MRESLVYLSIPRADGFLDCDKLFSYFGLALQAGRGGGGGDESPAVVYRKHKKPLFLFLHICNHKARSVKRQC